MSIWKVCPSCRCRKPILAFCVARATKDGRYFECKTCDKIRTAGKPKYVRKTPPKKYPTTPEKAAYKKAWREANRERVRASNAKAAARDPEKTRQQKREYSARNPDAVNAKTAEYRSRKKHAVPKWANPKKIRSIYAKAKADTVATGTIHAVDHIVPLQSKIVCGLHCEFNLQVLTRSENCKKGNRHWPNMP